MVTVAPQEVKAKMQTTSIADSESSGEDSEDSEEVIEREHGYCQTTSTAIYYTLHTTKWVAHFW
jgi:hypothetical protein